MFNIKRKISQLPIVRDTSIWYPREERAAKRLRHDAAILHVPAPESFWSIRNYEGDSREGAALIEVHNERAHSFNRNAFNIDLSILGCVNGVATFGAGLISLRDTAGAIRGNGVTLSLEGTNVELAGLGYRGDTANHLQGIAVGTGSTASTFEDFALETPIVNGTSAGELSYVEGEPLVRTYDGGPRLFTIDHPRFINNNSGGSIGVNELALIGEYNPSFHNCIVSHDVLGATVTVLDTGQLKVTYTISLTYTA